MFSHSDLLIFDPNLITHLLHTNMTNNFFEFSNSIFQQTSSMAMGASFSPTIANIFMSFLLKSFLSSSAEKPLFTKRYIDDIFLLWPQHQNINEFFHRLNNYHPKIKFTINQSNTSINFLDLMILKNGTNKLNIRTYQKECNLFQYLHFTSDNPKATLKGLIRGEAIRYVRTNSLKEDYEKQLHLFTLRLKSRNYRPHFITRALKKVNYNTRPQYLQRSTKTTTQLFNRPILKSITPPSYHNLKKIILQEFMNYNMLKFTNRPLFVTLKNSTLNDILVRSKHRPTAGDSKKIISQTKLCNNFKVFTFNIPKERSTVKPSPLNAHGVLRVSILFPRVTYKVLPPNNSSG